jgi:type IV secretion system protein VirB5
MSQNTIESQPFLRSKALYDDLYGSAEKRYKTSVVINIVLSIALIISIFGLISLGGQAKYIPYLVSTDGHSTQSLGTVSDEPVSDENKKVLNKYFITQFIKKMREISVDGAVEEENIAAAYSFARGSSLTNAMTYFKENNPFDIAKESITSIEKFNYIMAISENTIKAKWREVIRDSRTGEVRQQRTMVGEFTTEWDAPSQSLQVLKSNPLGFYVKSYTWSEEQI